jgi:hypothetical protein
MKPYETRIKFLKGLPCNGKVAEIGVYKGDHAKMIKEVNTPEELYLIDLWAIHDTPYTGSLRKYSKNKQHVRNYGKVKNMFKDDEHIKLIKKSSLEAVKEFEDEYFDYVYIDADHTYEAAKDDINHWYKKVKVGGYLCGHDYLEEAFCNFGVRRAVDEFIEESNLELELGPKIRFREWKIKKK